jgi:hypothetical protein
LCNLLLFYALDHLFEGVAGVASHPANRHFPHTQNRYGDLSPTTAAGKCFTCLFGFSGIALLGAVIATIGSKLVQAEMDGIDQARKESRKRLFQLMEGMPKLVQSIRGGNKQEQHKLIQETKELLGIAKLKMPQPVSIVFKFVRYVYQSLAVVVVGGLVIGKLEGWNWLDSLYYSLITGMSLPARLTSVFVHEIGMLIQ